jgi:SAM-dependent methyltransferase
MRRIAVGVTPNKPNGADGALDGPFDIAFAIHCIYFWAKPIDGLRELRRILKPRGLLTVTIQCYRAELLPLFGPELAAGRAARMSLYSFGED